MSGTGTLISVIIPVYNGERYLGEAIRSVLAQGYRPLEVIVVDDGSMDASAEIARAFGRDVHVRTQPRAGAAAGRNLGVSLANGELLAFLDADDLWADGKLARQATAFEQDPGLEMVFGYASQFHSPDLPPEQRGKIARAREVMPAYIPGAMLIRRDSFLRVGSFATDWRVGEFIDWYSRAIDLGLRSLLLDDIVLLRRIHAGNMGIHERDSRRDYARILKAAMDRRRAVKAPGKSGAEDEE